MVLYLAGLKSVDNTLREAASIDGANARQTFFRVIFPVLAPINVVVLVVTIIESLRAFDIVYVTNKGLNGLELLSVLITTNLLGEASLIGFGSAIAVILLLISIGPIIYYLYRTMRERAGMTTTDVSPPTRTNEVVTGKRRRPHVGTHLFLIVISRRLDLPARVGRLHLAPAVRRDRGPPGLRLDRRDLQPRQLLQGGPGDGPLAAPAPHVPDRVVPAMILVLWFASMIAFAVSRYSFRFNIALLMLFTAGNLLPQQVVITPLYRMYLALPLPAPAVRQRHLVRPVLRHRR